MDTILFTIILKKIHYLGINLTKRLRISTLNILKTYAHVLVELILGKMSFDQKWFTDLCNSNQNPLCILHRNRKTNLKFMSNQKSQITKTIFCKKNNAREIITFQSLSNNHSMVQKQTCRPLEQNQRPNMSLCNCTYLIFDKRCQTKMPEKSKSLQHMVLGELDHVEE